MTERPAETTRFACKQCGGPTQYLEGSSAMQCLQCGFENPIERAAGAAVIEYDFDEGLRNAATLRPADMFAGGHEMRCNQCGAQVITQEISTRCPYCDAPAVAEVKTGEPLVHPQSLLPFAIKRDAALGAFRSWLSSRWFAPNDLTKRAREERIDGVYLPYWTYDSATTTRYTGERGTFYYVDETYTDSKGEKQTRRVKHTRWDPVSGTVPLRFDDVLVPASESLPREMLEKLEPWDLPALVPYAPQYLVGFGAERYRIDLSAGFQRANELMSMRIHQAIRQHIGGDDQRVTTTNTQHANVTFKHLLLPLWISAFRYNEKVFRFCVNARSGEVQGERPYSVPKIVAAVVAGVGAVLGIVGTVQGWW